MCEWYKDIVVKCPTLLEFDTRYYNDEDERVVIDINSITLGIHKVIIYDRIYYSISASGNGWRGDITADIPYLLSIDDAVNVISGILIVYKLGFISEV